MSIRGNLSIRVVTCDNFAIDTLAPVTIDAKPYPWTARVSSDILVHVKHQMRDDERDGSLVFSGVATNGDQVAIVTRGDVEHVFVFGNGTGGTVDHGATATNSAQNLKAAMNAYMASISGDLIITGGAGTLSFVTHDPFVHIEKDIDTGVVMSLTPIDYTTPATAVDAPFTEFRDLFFAVAEGETLSFLGGENGGLCSVAEVKISV